MILRAVALRLESGAITSTSTPSISRRARRAACKPGAEIPSSLVKRTRTWSILGVRDGGALGAEPRSRPRGTRMKALEASVVIPTKDRPEALGRCLAALRGLAGAEVVVVDDGSTQQKRVAEIAQEAGAKLVRLEGIGPAAARNAGVQAAQWEVICFTDDDCEVGAGWVQRLVEPIVAGDAECTAGRTTVASDASAADRAWQAIANYLQQVAAEPGSSSPGFASTCNLACSRKLLTELPFDESFPTAAGEDRDWAARAATRGSTPSFIPQALVTHRPDLDTRSFLRQQYRYGRGAARYRATEAGRKLGSPSFYTGLLKASFSQGLAPGLLVCAAQLATAAGIAVERSRFAGKEGGTSRTGRYSKSSG